MPLPLKRLLVLAALLACPASSSAQGVLGQVRDEVRSPNPSDSGSNQQPAGKSNSNSDGRSNFDDCQGDTELWSMIGKLTWYTISSPFWVPMSIAGDKWDRHGVFPSQPYADAVGYLMFAPDILPDERYDWSLMSEFNFASNLDDVSRFGSRFLFESSYRWGFDAEVNRWQEDGGATTDHLWLGDANLVLRFAQSPHMRWRVGAGVNWLADTAGTDFGFNFTYGGDFFPAEPWVITGTIDWGTLGHATLFHAQATAGAMFRGVETFVGVDALRIDVAHLNTFLVGVRFWQ